MQNKPQVGLTIFIFVLLWPLIHKLLSISLLPWKCPHSVMFSSCLSRQWSLPSQYCLCKTQVFPLSQANEPLGHTPEKNKIVPRLSFKFPYHQIIYLFRTSLQHFHGIYSHGSIWIYLSVKDFIKIYIQIRAFAIYTIYGKVCLINVWQKVSNWIFQSFAAMILIKPP